MDASAEHEKSDGSCEEISSPSSFSGQNSPSSINGEADADSLSSPMVRQGRRTKRRRKRMLTGVSRQRRAANERERRRIQGVNRAFVELKNTLPVAHLDISKIDILRIATKWIDHLSQLLNKDKKEATDNPSRTARDLEIFDILGEQFSVDDYELQDNDFTQGEGKPGLINDFDAL